MSEEFDAFISYSRADRAFAEALESALESFKAPADLGVPQRPLSVFRDISDLTGNEYFSSIESQLRNSVKLILVCSPAAHRSEFVNDEIQRFIEAQGARGIIPVLLDGVPNNEASAGQADALAFPRALTDALELPLAVDYRGWSAADLVDDGAHKGAWYTLLADLYGVSRAQIEARDALRRARDRALWSRNLAVAALRALAAEPELALLLAVKAVNITRSADSTVTSQAEEALHTAVEVFQRRRTVPELVLSGHQDAVWDVQYLPDGATLATCSEDKSWRQWDASTGAQLAVMTGNPPHGVVKRVRFRTDGQALVTAHLDGFAKHWTRGSARSIYLQASCWGVAYSPAGDCVATAGLDGGVKVWDIKTGEARHSFTLPGPAVTVDFSPDGKRLAAAGKFGAAKIWDLTPEHAEVPLEGHSEVVIAIAFSPDGKYVATGSEDSTWRLWDAASGKQLRAMSSPGGEAARPGEKGVNAVAFHGEGHQLATGCRDKSATVWDLRSGRELLTIKGHAGGVWAVAFHPGGRQMATASYDHTAKLWDASPHHELLIRLYGGDDVRSLAFDPDGKCLYAGGHGGTVVIWEIASAVPLHAFSPDRGTISALAFHQQDRVLVTAEGNGTVGLWSPTGDALRYVKVHDESVVSVSFSLDGKLLLTAAFDGEVKLWEWGTMKMLGAISTGADELRAAAISPDGAWIAAALSGHEWAPTTPSNSTARIWNAATLEHTQTLEGHSRPLSALAFSPKGTMLATTSQDHTARLWDVQTGRQVASLSGHLSRLESVAFSPDGSRLVTASIDRTIKLWRTGARAESLTLPGHTDQVMCVAFSPDGTMIASGARDGAVLLHHTSVETLLPLAAKAVARKLSDDEAAQYAPA